MWPDGRKKVSPYWFSWNVTEKGMVTLPEVLFDVTVTE